MTSADEFLLRLLSEQGLIAPEIVVRGRLECADQLRSGRPIRLRQWLFESGGLREDELASMLARHFGLGLALDLRERRATEMLLERFPLHLAVLYQVVPLRELSFGFEMAIDDPLDELRLEAIAEKLGQPVIPILSTTSEIRRVLQVWSAGASGESLVREAEGRWSADQTPIGSDVSGLEKRVLNPGADVSIAMLVETLISDAIRRRASDIHLEPMETRFRVRNRVDGHLFDAGLIPREYQAAAISRIKLMAAMSISERRVPQDGRIRHSEAQDTRDIRVSSVPTIWGESLVLRILGDRGLGQDSLELGLSAEDLARWNQAVGSPDGMVLVTGPTGSGKTTTLYSVLRKLNQAYRKIVTVEDPVEFEIAGINQVAVRPEVNVTFSSVLRAVLRQSPDVIMVGEIRDRESAEISVNAALTGHLVFSTLHTNDAAGAISRLVNLGAKPCLVSSSLKAVLAQRLVRRVCPSCRVEQPATPIERRFLHDVSGGEGIAYLAHGKGCADCGGTGYRGRLGIFELLVMDEEIQRAVHRGVPVDELRRLSSLKGHRTLREDGLRKVLAGLTTLDEVLSATISGSN